MKADEAPGARLTRAFGGVSVFTVGTDIAALETLRLTDVDTVVRDSAQRGDATRTTCVVFIGTVEAEEPPAAGFVVDKTCGAREGGELNFSTMGAYAWLPTSSPSSSSDEPSGKHLEVLEVGRHCAPQLVRVDVAQTPMVQKRLIEVGPAVSQRLSEPQGGQPHLRQGRHDVDFLVLPPAPV